MRGPTAPTDLQVAHFTRLAQSPVFTDEERKRALDWLATKATRQTIKEQTDLLIRRVTEAPVGRGAPDATGGDDGRCVCGRWGCHGRCVPGNDRWSRWG
jgi:hypothetical protein